MYNDVCEATPVEGTGAHTGLVCAVVKATSQGNLSLEAVPRIRGLSKIVWDQDDDEKKAVPTYEQDGFCTIAPGARVQNRTDLTAFNVQHNSKSAGSVKSFNAWSSHGLFQAHVSASDL